VPDATWLELCIDVADPRSGMAQFWAHAVGGRATTPRDTTDPGDVVGTPPGGSIAMCPVPEGKTVKHRVHLDVHTAGVQDLVDAGATVLREPDDEISWTVLADPEGGELCAFVREQVPDYRLYEVIVDSADPERVARWWAARFGVEATSDGGTEWVVGGIPGAPFDQFVFDVVPEPKTVKNRIHWDVHGDVDDFVAAGATHLWDTKRWTVLADPEGNEFCVFPPENR
jgi:hypothetical protein